MKTSTRILTCLLGLMISISTMAQSSVQGNLNEGKVVNTRAEDIDLFKEYMTMVTNAATANSGQETKMWLNKLMGIAASEITRSKANLQDLKDGKTEHLEKWMEENQPEVKLNIKGEIHTLTSRIRHEEYLYGRMKDFDVSRLSEDRYASTLRGTMNSFLRDIQKNLRYSGNEKSAPPPPPPPKESKGKYTKKDVKGEGFVLHTGNTEQIEKGDPRLDDYYASKKLRARDFQSGKAIFNKYVNTKDDFKAKTAFKNVYQIMMDETNANNWFLSMINSGGIVVKDADVPQLTKTLEKQQRLVHQGAKLKSTLSSDFEENKSQISALMESFAATM